MRSLREALLALIPQGTGNDQRIYLPFVPPLSLLRCFMKLLVVDCAKRHREFIADLKTQSSNLRVSHVVRVRWRPSTDHAGLASDETKVLLASYPSRLADRECALVDLPQVFPRLRLIDGVVSVAVSERDGASLEVRHQLRSDV